MVSVKCIYYATIQTILNRKKETFEVAPNTTVEDILDRIIAKYGSRVAGHIYSEGYIEGRYFKTASVYVNKKRIQWIQDFPLGLKTVLKDGDILSLGLVMGGG